MTSPNWNAQVLACSMGDPHFARVLPRLAFRVSEASPLWFWKYPGKIENCATVFGLVKNSRFWKITIYNFQSRRPLGDFKTMGKKQRRNGYVALKDLLTHSWSTVTVVWASILLHHPLKPKSPRLEPCELIREQVHLKG